MNEKTGIESTAAAVRRSDVGTNLAVNRTYLAAERTLMAWIRTALSMISFGFTIGKLGQVMETVEVRKLLGGTRTLGVEAVAYFLVIFGTVALVAAALQHWRRMRALYAMGLKRQLSITFIVALVLSLLGGLALSSLVTAF